MATKNVNLFLQKPWKHPAGHSGFLCRMQG